MTTRNFRVNTGLSVGDVAVTASSNAFNQAYEKDIDAKMKRTKDRPVPDGRMSFIEATAFGTVIGILGFVLLFKLTNPISAFLVRMG